MTSPSPIASHAAWTVTFKDLIKKKTNLSTLIEKREKDLRAVDKLREDQLAPLEARLTEMRNGLHKTIRDLQSEKEVVERDISKEAARREHHELTKTKKEVADEIAKLGQSRWALPGANKIQPLTKRIFSYK